MEQTALAIPTHDAGSRFGGAGPGLPHLRSDWIKLGAHCKPPQASGRVRHGITSEALQERPSRLLARKQDAARLLALRLAARQHVQERRFACRQSMASITTLILELISTHSKPVA